MRRPCKCTERPLPCSQTAPTSGWLWWIHTHTYSHTLTLTYGIIKWLDFCVWHLYTCTHACVCVCVCLGFEKAVLFWIFTKTASAWPWKFFQTQKKLFLLFLTHTQTYTHFNAVPGSGVSHGRTYQRGREDDPWHHIKRRQLYRMLPPPICHLQQAWQLHRGECVWGTINVCGWGWVCLMALISAAQR